jgi:LmbE family N-acetylglucosaminyl deacetylase
MPTWALAIVDEDRQLLRLVTGGQGQPAAQVDSVQWKGVRSAQLGELAKQLGARAVIAVERSAIATLSRQIEPALRAKQDLVEQGLVALRALKSLAGKGVWSYPELLELLPAPSYDSVQRTFDLLIPDESALLAYVIEDDRQRVHTSVLARKRRGSIDHVTTHQALRHAVSEEVLARSWLTVYPRVLAAAEEVLARPSVGIFLERATLQRIMTGPSDQLSRELSAKRVVIDPAPTWLLGLLGGATMAAVAGRGARVLAAMLPAAARGRASGLAQRATAAMRESGMHPFALLGFDPLELWAQLQAFYRPER